ncbi:LTA synthase family protein [Lacticaseibacillus sharpeae]|uniref:Sulfatase N-terminal domain-containing protein n=1 Tax=Lacticaseibacillus sharpeae JCM 1186 = DSM 20505 TaxID=1291052 RepID=A0A0R1ZTL9_9LACO|nr:LTA synthase family protein [Lacticaseibacillus sharpeae]KRM55065.1 hypothetical protein FC18_GL001662 [Lacticaseibacillus sharpeae JCM 1186 = DSM 20505]
MNQKFRENKSNVARTALGLVLSFILIAGYLLFIKLGVVRFSDSVAKLSLSWLVFNTIRYLFYVFVAASLMLIFRLNFAKFKRSGTLLTTWMFFIVFLVVTTVFALTQNSTLGAGALYGSVFVVSRGVFPFVTGVLAVMALSTLIERAAKIRGITALFILVLTMPIIFNTNIFYFGTGWSVTGIVALGFASAISANIHRHRKTIVALSVVASVASIIIMGIVSQQYHGNLETALRFISMSSPLIIVPAMVITSYIPLDKSSDKIKANTKLDFITITSLASLVTITGQPYTSILKSWNSYFQKSFGEFPGLLVSSLIYAAVIALVAFVLYQWVVSSPTGKSLQSSRYDCSIFELSDYVHVNFKKCMHGLVSRHGLKILAIGAVLILQALAVLSTHQSLKMVNLMSRPDMSILWFSFVLRWQTILIGTVFVLAVFWFFLGLSNRYWFSLITTTVISLVLSIATYIKTGARSEPIMPADLDELNSISQLLQMVSPVLLIGALIAVIVLAVGVFFLEKRTGSFKLRHSTRIVLVVLPIVFFGFIKDVSIEDTAMSNFFENFSIYKSASNPLLGAQENGPYLQFARNMNIVVMAKPSGYSKAGVKQVYKRYSNLAHSINVNRKNKLSDQTFIFNLSEAFSDPARIPGLKLNTDPIPNIHKLEKSTTSGLMLSFGYGGGTANTEFEAMTGLTQGNFDTRISSPYSQLVEHLNVAPNISQGFDYSSAIHPFVGTFYNRIGVFKKFGINKFAYLGSKYKISNQKKLGNSTYLSDETAYDNALKQLKEKSDGQFINLISIQNHYPYTGNLYPNTSFKASGNASSGTGRKQQIENYAQGINYTDTAVAKFKKKLDSIDKPITWVFYGDHLPASIYDSVMSSHTSLLLHQTDYFVYSNKYAREHGAATKLNGRPYAGANDFISLALEQANVKVNAYEAMLTEVSKKLPVPWIKILDETKSSTYGMRFVNSNGGLLHYASLTKKQKQILHDYQIIQYDITAGKQYSQKLGMRP